MPKVAKADAPSVAARQPVKKETKFTEIIEPPAALEIATAEAEEAAEPSYGKLLKERLLPYDFWEALCRLTKEDWNHIDCYLYRHKGQTFDQTDAPPRGHSWLDKFAEPFTIDYVREHYGGGYYWARVNCSGVIAKSLNFRIEGPPKLDGALPVSTQGDPYKDFLIKMVQEQMQEIKANMTKPDEAVARVLEVMGKANDATIQMLTKQLPEKVDPMQQLTALLALLKEVKDVQAPAPAAAAPAESQDQGFLKNLELMERLGLLKKPNEDGLSGIAKTVEALKGLGLIPSTGGASGEPDWKVALAQNADKLLQHVEGIVGRITTAIVQQRQAGPVQIAQRSAATIRPGATLVGERPAAQNAAPAPEAQPPGGSAAPAMTEEQQIAQATANVESWLWIRVCELMKGGETGDAVAELLQKLSPELATFLGAQSSAELETLVSTHPILQQISGHPRLKAFLAEFHSYFAPEEETGGESKPAENS